MPHRPHLRLTIASVTAAGFFSIAAGATLALTLAEVRFRYGSPLAEPNLPVDARSYERLAQRIGQEPAPDAGRIEALLRQAVTLNSRSSLAWIALGLAAERNRNWAEAERDLLRAARVDHQYLPAWTLANFYFRRGSETDFWPWARRAAMLCYGDLIPVVKLCDRMDPGSVLTGLRDSPAVERAYLDLLVRERRLDEAQVVAHKVCARGDPADRPRLIAFTSLQIDAGSAAAAREIWNWAWPGAALLTNGELRTPPSGLGFDWRIPAVDGIRFEWREARLSFFLSGRQPETCVLLEQPLVLEARPYRLRFEYSIPSVRAVSMPDLHWGIDSKGIAGIESAALAGGASTGEWVFRLPNELPHGGLIRLLLFYRRTPGMERAMGSLELRKLRLEAL